MMWLNIHENLTVEGRPTRIRLADGSTRTNEAITDELLAETGWIPFIDNFTLSTSTNVING